MENILVSDIDLEVEYLAHHGVKGMKWGVRRYQPYSLIPRGSGKGGKETGAAKASAKNAVSAVKKKLSSSIKISGKTNKLSEIRNAKPKSRKQKQTEKQEELVKNLNTARQRKEAASKVVNSGSAKDVYLNKDSLTTTQLKNAIDRINTEKTLKQLYAEQNPSKLTKLKKVVNKENIQKLSDTIDSTASLYNNIARVANVGLDEQHKLKYVGKAENKKQTTDDILKILNSGDADLILKNQSKLSDEQIRNAKQRLQNLSEIKKNAAGEVKPHASSLSDSIGKKNNVKKKG